jgi:hypothetical protein
VSVAIPESRELQALQANKVLRAKQEYRALRVNAEKLAHREIRDPQVNAEIPESQAYKAQQVNAEKLGRREIQVLQVLV